jgi:hypothetical protein
VTPRRLPRHTRGVQEPLRDPDHERRVAGRVPARAVVKRLQARLQPSSYVFLLRLSANVHTLSRSLS